MVHFHLIDYSKKHQETLTIIFIPKELRFHYANRKRKVGK